MSSLVFLALVSCVAADDFLTKLVLDIKANPKDYLNYVQTATASIPDDLTPLALQVRTYTDDSYTTLVDSGEKSQLLAFMTGLPWYSSRILGETGADDTAAETSASATESGDASTSSGNAGPNMVVHGAVGIAALAAALL